MANVLFSRTSDPSSKPITDGQLIFDTSGNGKMYLDNGTERLEMGGSISVDSVLNAESTNPIQNKAVAGVMLKTLDEVNAVTKAGFITDALAAKELSNTVNTLNSNLDADGTPFRFGKDAEGNFGYIITDETGADSVVPFKGNPKFERITGITISNYGSDSYVGTKTYTFTESGIFLVVTPCIYVKYQSNLGGNAAFQGGQCSSSTATVETIHEGMVYKVKANVGDTISVTCVGGDGVLKTHKSFSVYKMS